MSTSEFKIPEVLKGLIPLDDSTWTEDLFIKLKAQESEKIESGRPTGDEDRVRHDFELFKIKLASAVVLFGVAKKETPKLDHALYRMEELEHAKRLTVMFEEATRLEQLCEVEMDAFIQGEIPDVPFKPGQNV